ncbi:MAG: VCBS repeat-containing protein [Planctomycetota bacterium]
MSHPRSRRESWTTATVITAAILMQSSLTPAQVSFLPGKDYSVAPGQRPIGIVAADLDQDGNVDLVTGNFNSGDIAILMGLGDGTFETPPKLSPAGGRPTYLAVCDLDEDGDLDLVAALSDLPGGVAVLENHGAAIFTLAATLAAGRRPGDVVCCDVDGTSGPDIVVCSDASDSVSLLRNTGDLTFAPARDYSVGDNPQSICCGDFDGSGGPDVAVACFSGSISVLLNTGFGSFQRSVDYPVSSGLRGIACCDFDQDGADDLLIGGVSRTVMLWNNGDGSFGTATEIAAAGNAFAVDCGDPNGDGVPDAVLVSNASDAVTVCLSTGSRTWAVQPPLPVDDDPRGLTVFSREGIVNVATANTNSSSSTVLSNLGIPRLEVRHTEFFGFVSYEADIHGPPAGIGHLFGSTRIVAPFFFPGVSGALRVDPSSLIYFGPMPLGLTGVATVPIGTVPEDDSFTLILEAIVTSSAGEVQATNGVAFGQGATPGKEAVGRGVINTSNLEYEVVVSGPAGEAVKILTGAPSAELGSATIPASGVAVIEGKVPAGACGLTWFRLGSVIGATILALLC